MSNDVPLIDPRRTVLLVMDYQLAVLGILEDAVALLKRAASAIAIVRQRGGLIGYVKVGFKDEDFDALPSRSKMASIMAGSGRIMHIDSPLTVIHEEVSPQEGDIVVHKTRFSAFSTTDLDQQLSSRNIDTLILAGVTTGGGVLSTVLDAFDRDYVVYVLDDACDEIESEVHEFLMTKIFPKKAHVITIVELDRLLSGI